MDAVILCGGEGTRIRHLLPGGVPKCMADINGTPFLDLLLSLLTIKMEWGRIILCTGYKHGYIWGYYCWGHSPYTVWFSEEKQALGTAGAVKNALSLIQSDHFFIFNADTYCDVDFEAMLAYHKATNSIITVACDKGFRSVGTFIASRQFVDFIQPLDSGLCKGCGHEWEEHNIGGQYERECSACGDCYDYEFNPKNKVDIEDVLTILCYRHESVGWFVTDAPFYDIGSPEGLRNFRNYWARLSKGGEERMGGNFKESV